MRRARPERTGATADPSPEASDGAAFRAARNGRLRTRSGARRAPWLVRVGLRAWRRRRGALATARLVTVACRLWPLDPDLQTERARLLAAQGDLRSAIACLERVLHRHPGHVRARFVLGNLWLQARRPEAAAEAFAVAAALEPGEPRHLFNLGHARKDAGDARGALQAFSAALRMAPDFHKARFMVAYMLTVLGRLEEAAVEYERTVRGAPRYVKAYYNLGNCRMRLGDLEGARRAYARVLALDDRYAKGHLAWAQLLAARGLLDEAVQAAGRALALCPDLDDARLLRDACAEALAHLRPAPPSPMRWAEAAGPRAVTCEQAASGAA